MLRSADWWLLSNICFSSHPTVYFLSDIILLSWQNIKVDADRIQYIFLGIQLHIICASFNDFNVTRYYVLTDTPIWLGSNVLKFVIIYTIFKIGNRNNQIEFFFIRFKKTLLCSFKDKIN